MICAVSLNPAVDKYLRLPVLRRGEHQQVAEVVTSAGGKAINGAGVMRQLGEEVLLLGFFGGYTGDYLLDEVTREGIRADPVRVSAPTRTAFVLVEEDGSETEIVEPGAPVEATALAKLRAKLRQAARGASVVLLSGSVPPGCPEDVYQLLIEDCGGICPVLLDTSREWLRRVVMAPHGAARPHAIKPNRREAEQLLGRSLHLPAEFAAALTTLRQRGIPRPLISDGAQGLYGAQAEGGLERKGAEEERRHASAPAVRRVNSVGSGDAAFAGFAVGLARGWPWRECLRLASACGAANTMTQECAQVHAADVERLLPQVQLTTI